MKNKHVFWVGLLTIIAVKPGMFVVKVLQTNWKAGLNERAIRFVFRDKYTSYSELLNALGLSSLKQQRLIKITLSIFNAVHNSLAPKSIQDLIVHRKNVSYNLRGDYTRLQKRWHATSVYNERWDSAKSYPNFPGRKRFIMRKDFPWIMREVNHWLCICANISHKGDGSCRSWIKLIRCQRFCNRVYILSLPKPKSTTYGLNSVRYIGPKLWNSIPNMFRNITNFKSFKRSISQVDLVQFL